MSNKCTLIIDGNWLLMRNLHAFGLNNFNLDKTQEERENSSTLLNDMLARSIITTVNTFDGCLDNVIFVADGGDSWRKNIEKPIHREVDYKGTRKPDESVDWSTIWGGFNKFQQDISNKMTVSKVYRVEGDDWVWYWSNRLLHEGENSIIWTVDNDLKQLVKLNNGHFIAWYNEKNGLFFPEELNDKCDDEIEFFMNQDKDNELTLELKRRVSKYSFIDGKDIIISKILQGDNSDNIKSIIQIKKNSKTYGVNNKDMQNIYERIHINTLSDFFSQKNNIIDLLLKSKNISEDKQNIIEEFDYNTQLVWMDKSQYPKEVLKSIIESVDFKVCDIDYIKNNYKQLLGTENSVEKLFEEIEF